MRTIRLYGRLAKFIGRRTFKAEVANVAEAVRCLLANFPGLEAHMSEQHYKVKVGQNEITEGEVHFPSSEQEDIRIIPVITGAGAAGRVIAGIGLIAAAFLFPLGSIGLFGLAAPIALNAVAFGLGASLVLGGVAQLLTPVPKTQVGPKSDTDPRASYSFSGIQNVSRQGVPVPVCYGEVLVGSVVISAGIDITEVSA